VAPAPAPAPSVNVNVSGQDLGKKMKPSGAAFYGLVFLVTLIIAFFIFYLMKPSIVMKKFGDRVLDEVDFVKVLIASVIVALIVVILAWLFRSSAMKSLC
jgi:uncharacterized membrane protein YdbT with pleckstrin-like domain